MKGDAIVRVTTALRDRLKVALDASGVPGTVFVGPLDDPDAGSAALILFLYRIMPNASLRNREHRVTSATPPPPVVVYQNALPLDLYYLVTIGKSPGAGEEVMLRQLGFVMQALQLAPELTGAATASETVRVSLEPLTTDESSRIWALFPTANYRTSIAYLATPVWIDPVVAEAVAAPVREDELLAGTATRSDP